MQKKRITIYDIAKELSLSPSYVSKALNDHPSINDAAREKVKQKAKELNYKHNSLAANLRNGSSKTIGVIVPAINQRFFSDVIAGIEEKCNQEGHSLIICQSLESFELECKAIDTLIRQNVDCILISVSSQTKTMEHLLNAQVHDISLIQFDRCMEDIQGIKVLNNTFDSAYKATKAMIDAGYKSIAFLGGPAHIETFSQRKAGFLKAIEEAEMLIPYVYINENVLPMEEAKKMADKLLSSKLPPDAFLTVSDHQALGVMESAEKLGISIPKDLGLFGFANEDFSALVKPGLSSVDQMSKQLGISAASAYFEHKKSHSGTSMPDEVIYVDCELRIRDSINRGSKG